MASETNSVAVTVREGAEVTRLACAGVVAVTIDASLGTAGVLLYHASKMDVARALAVLAAYADSLDPDIGPLALAFSAEGIAPGAEMDLRPPTGGRW